MFIGGLPDEALHQLVRLRDLSSWNSVWVLCSGSFRIERTINKFFPALPVHSNDVSLLSCAIGALATSSTFDIRFKEALGWFEDELAAMESTSFRDRVAASLVAGQLTRFAKGKPNAYKTAHVAHIRGRFPELIEKARAKLNLLTASLALSGFDAGDFRLQIHNAGLGLLAMARLASERLEQLEAESDGADQ